ncbi:helix-turn-helix domain-containing protein [Sphingomonas sp. KC8]|uniref:helix-turn-helix domain-containing protein n=1 Tax=Sphingomonas sp. KC8 TaxID=1030157 RepID=UPI00130356CB|nr:helix-turn-helix transcriptional regulator [Sphingomonas sp. KC8]
MSDAPNRIRELRLAANLSQQKVGDAIGVSKVTISELELGKMSLTVDYMRRIAPVLGVTPAELLLASDNPHLAQADERDLLERYRAADDAQREQIQRVTEALMPYRADPRRVA